MTTSDQPQFESHAEALQLPLYVAGGLDPSERERLEQHLSQCLSCQKELADEQRLQPAIQEALTLWPKSTDRVLQRAKGKIDRLSQQEKRDDGEVNDNGESWVIKLEDWIRRLFTPRWMPALALLVVFVQGVVLQQLLTSPSPTVPLGMEGPVFERELPSQPERSVNIHSMHIRFSKDLTVEGVQSILNDVRGTIIQGPLGTGEFIVEIPYTTQGQLHSTIANLKSIEGIEHVDSSQP